MRGILLAKGPGTGESDMRDILPDKRGILLAMGPGTGEPDMGGILVGLLLLIRVHESLICEAYINTPTLSRQF